MFSLYTSTPATETGPVVGLYKQLGHTTMEKLLADNVVSDGLLTISLPFRSGAADKTVHFSKNRRQFVSWLIS